MNRKTAILAAAVVMALVAVVAIAVVIRNSGRPESDARPPVGASERPSAPEARCGNLVCEEGEDWQSCPNDCPPVPHPEYDLSPRETTLGWNSAIPTTATVTYGVGDDWDGLDNVLEIDRPGTEHSLPISGLEPNTIYNYRIISRDADGNVVAVTDSEFRTLAE